MARPYSNLSDGLRGHRFEAVRFALSERTVKDLAKIKVSAQ
jgi:hypothetical protein